MQTVKIYYFNYIFKKFAIKFCFSYLKFVNLMVKLGAERVPTPGQPRDVGLARLTVPQQFRRKCLSKKRVLKRVECEFLKNA